MTVHRTLFLVGSGAVENAWEPVIDGLRGLGFHDLYTAEGATFAMAHLVYMVRLAHLRKGDPLGQSADEILETLASARRAIASSINDAEKAGRLRTRAEFQAVLREVVLADSRSIYLVTTNWDGTAHAAVRNELSGVDALYLHGRASDPDSLYLPSEIVEEPYRSPRQLGHLQEVRKAAVQAITMATRIVIYGLSISPLDAELGALVYAGQHSSTVREIHVIDPQHRAVTERLATLGELGTAALPIFSRHPENLGDIVRFPGP